MHRSKAGHWIRILGADFPLSRVDAAAVDRFVEQRTSEGAKQTTIHKELTTLRVALKIALRRGLWSGRLDSVMPEGHSLEYVPKQRALTREELARLLLVLPAHRAARVSFIVGSSARWGESESARPEDVTTDAVMLRGTKTAASARTVPLVGFMSDLVERARAHIPFAPWGAVRRDLAAACKRAGIAPVTPNDLRRTTATWLRHGGVEPHLIAVVLGHTDSRMVERVYGRYTHDALKEALEGRIGCDTGVSATGKIGGLGGRRGPP